ncbi:MAG: hypothetical protein WBX20_10850, partial [Terrimicrobiaceae bacterium]
AVLVSHSNGLVALLDPACLVNNPGIDWPENWNYLGAHCFPKGLRLPRTIADKLLELLLINPEASSHWLHALAAPRQQESLHIERGSFATLPPT